MLKRIVSTFFLAIIFVVLSSNFVYAVRNIETTDISNNCKGVSVQENMTTDSITEMLQLTVDVVETQQLILNTNINSNVIEQETIEEKTEYMDPVNHDIAITFTSEYISKPDVMPYALYTPSSVKNNAESSLIVWLHGLGEVNVDSNTFLSAGLPTIIDN